MGRKDIQIKSGLTGLQDHTIDRQCGLCGKEVAFVVVAQHATLQIQWLACPRCKHGSVLTGDKIYPRRIVGENVQGLPETINSAYIEARRTISANCYTACEMMCRKILMNVAVDKGAPKGKSFAEYIDYMVDAGHITSVMEPWVKKIKDNGNDATHEIHPPDLKRAESTLKFTLSLLRNVYETAYDMQEIFKPDDSMSPVQRGNARVRSLRVRNRGY